MTDRCNFVIDDFEIDVSKTIVEITAPDLKKTKFIYDEYVAKGNRMERKIPMSTFKTSGTYKIKVSIVTGEGETIESTEVREYIEV